IREDSKLPAASTRNTPVLSCTLSSSSRTAWPGPFTLQSGKGVKNCQAAAKDGAGLSSERTGAAEAGVYVSRCGSKRMPARRVDQPRAVVPGSPAYDPRRPGVRSLRIGARGPRVVVSSEPVVHPLPHIAEHVAQPESIGGLAAHRARTVLVISQRSL